MSQLIDLGKLRFYFAGGWDATTTYESNDIIKYGGNVYVYTYALKTSGNVPTDTTYWALMVEGFKFKGIFSPTTAYRVGDGIAYGAKVYVCVLDSTGIVPPNATYWSQFVDGIQYEGSYNTTTAYQKNDVVVYGGSTYIAKQDNTNHNPVETAYWDKFVEGVSAQSIYNNATAYVPGDLVAYGPNIYRAKVNTTGNVPTSTTQWDIYVTGTKFNGVYSAATTYYVNDLVLYGPNLFRAKLTIAGQTPQDGVNWELVTGGSAFKGNYDASTLYYPNDIVQYGSNYYRSTAVPNQTGILPTNSGTWTVFASGFNYMGTYSTSTQYYIGQVVSYGGSIFKAVRDTLNENPATVTAAWTKIVAGFKYTGNWATSIQYGIDEVVTYGGNSYITLVPHASTVFATDLAANKWQKFNSGIRWTGPWQANYNYLKDDIIKDSVGTAYIAAMDHTSGTDFTVDKSASKWTTFVIGGSDVLPALPSNAQGTALTIKTDGSGIDWIGATQSANTYYVAPHGTDATTSGKNLATPFASIKYACIQIAAAGQPATLYVKTGTYQEQLPITVPPNVAIIGDNQRTTIVTAKSGLSDDGITSNANATMWRMSNGSILNKMTFTGMTGWAIGGTPRDITTSTVKGIVATFNPASPITTKSPYILECSAICAGAIGALVDGSVHSSGAKTMIFHGYTVITDGGVGYWVKDGGKSEIVSCFTYYAYFGYAATGGGHIRALNGNNSYGTYGAVSLGYDSTETAITGTLVGKVLPFTYTGGNIAVSDTITGATSGATATVLNVQYSSDKVYVKNITGTFQTSETIRVGANPVGTVKAAVENQKGFVLVASGFSALPVSGASISLAGDTFSYVIQSTTGTWTNSASEIVLVLTQEKPTGSAEGVAVTIRYKYSQIRLTGHDFLSIGTGGISTTNYPGVPTQPPAQGNETVEIFPGRTFFVSTDQDGNYRVGKYFKIDQATGKATLNASAFDLSGLSSLRLGSIGAQLGEQINEFSSDVTMSGNSNIAVPTEYAVKTYVDTSVAAVSGSSGLGAKVSKSGDTMTGQLILSGAPTANLAAATKLYVDNINTTLNTSLTAVTNTANNANIYKLATLDTTANALIDLDTVGYFTTGTTITQNVQVDGTLMVVETTSGDTLQTITASPILDTTLTGSFVSTKQQYSIPTWATITVGTTSTVNIIDIPRTYLF
jgi:hypothetical protein